MLAVVGGVVDVGVGVDVIAPFSLSFLLISDCDGILTMDGWMDGRLHYFSSLLKKRKTTHDGTFIAVFYVFLFKFIRTNERMNQSIAVLYLHHHFIVEHYNRIFGIN